MSSFILCHLDIMLIPTSGFSLETSGEVDLRYICCGFNRHRYTYYPHWGDWLDSFRLGLTNDTSYVLALWVCVHVCKKKKKKKTKMC